MPSEVSNLENIFTFSNIINGVKWFQAKYNTNSL